MRFSRLPIALVSFACAALAAIVGSNPWGP